MISSNDFPFKTDGAVLASGALAVAAEGAIEAEVSAPAGADAAVVVLDVSPGFGAVVVPGKPILGEVALAVAGLLVPKPNSEDEAEALSPVVVEVEVSVVDLSPG